MNLTTFKKYIKALEREDLETEIFLLYKQFPEIKAYYKNASMTSDQRKTETEKLKEKIYAEFYTRSGNPKSPDNRKILSIIRDFEKIAKSPAEVIDLILSRVEIATSFASNFGGMPDTDYNAALNAFEKAVKLMAKHNLVDVFNDRCQLLFKTDNLDYWYIDHLEEIFKTMKPI